mmetsp:Transcript_527/g.1167  ORF Transcript_527/g.1167 Transcript_527/m.1167 type:complete len:135 (+) Transcript_527:938-1342(+)
MERQGIAEVHLDALEFLPSARREKERGRRERTDRVGPAGTLLLLTMQASKVSFVQEQTGWIDVHAPLCSFRRFVFEVSFDFISAVPSCLLSSPLLLSSLSSSPVIFLTSVACEGKKSFLMKAKCLPPGFFTLFR